MGIGPKKAASRRAHRLIGQFSLWHCLVVIGIIAAFCAAYRIDPVLGCVTGLVLTYVLTTVAVVRQMPVLMWISVLMLSFWLGIVLFGSLLGC